MSLHVSLLILQYTLLCIVFVSNNLVAILRLVIPTKKDVDLCEDKELLYDDFAPCHVRLVNIYICLPMHIYIYIYTPHKLCMEIRWDLLHCKYIL